MPSTATEPARRLIGIRVIGAAQLLANNASAVTVPIPASVNAFYFGSNCVVTFDGGTASATNGIGMNVSTGQTLPTPIPQGCPSLSVYGVASATYIQFCQMTTEC